MQMDDECWRLAENCVRWAVGNKHPNVRNAFLAMAKAWAQLSLDQGDNTDKAATIADNDKSAVALLGLAAVAEQLRAAASSIAPVVTASPPMLLPAVNLESGFQRLSRPQQSK
jgi:hypothetical protein